MSGNFPIEKDILHFRTLPNIVDDHVAAGLRGLSINHNSDMGHSSA
jgi:hypothetical protein